MSNQHSSSDGSGTRMESMEDIRKAIVGSQRTPTAREQSAVAETHPFRPVFRAPMAMLCILDDGSEDGEWFRIRFDKTVIGRSTAHVMIPHDPMISASHAEISRQPHRGGYRWHLVDLDSSNGTFVRVADTPIKHGQELLLGTRRFRFNAAPQGAAVLQESANTSQPQSTRGWQAVSPQALIPSLIEVTPQGEGQKFMLKGNDCWVGRDPQQCSVVLADDLMISPRHCRIWRDQAGQWHLDNAGSRNGTWIRVSKAPLQTNCQFQLGEQRFFIRILT